MRNDRLVAMLYALTPTLCTITTTTPLPGPKSHQWAKMATTLAHARYYRCITTPTNSTRPDWLSRRLTAWPPPVMRPQAYSPLRLHTLGATTCPHHQRALTRVCPPT